MGPQYVRCVRSGLLLSFSQVGFASDATRQMPLVCSGIVLFRMCYAYSGSYDIHNIHLHWMPPHSPDELPIMRESKRLWTSPRPNLSTAPVIYPTCSPICHVHHPRSPTRATCTPNLITSSLMVILSLIILCCLFGGPAWLIVSARDFLWPPCASHSLIFQLLRLVAGQFLLGAINNSSRIGHGPRKQNVQLHFTSVPELLENLSRFFHTIAIGCRYIRFCFAGWAAKGLLYHGVTT